MGTFRVEFHFPYATISLAREVYDEDIARWKSDITAGRIFYVLDNRKEYTINPAMLTYMDVRPWISF